MERDLARFTLACGAVQLRPDAPFTWASGHRMPLYNDNRRLLASPEARNRIVEGFMGILEAEEIPVEGVAGVATAGIPHATLLAHALRLPMLYVRTEAKKHGMAQQVEGGPTPGQRLAVVEDLVSTGSSAFKCVEALRQAQTEPVVLLCVFSYDLAAAEAASAQARLALRPLLSFATLLQVAKADGYIDAAQHATLGDWQSDPYGWSERRARARTSASSANPPSVNPPGENPRRADPEASS